MAHFSRASELAVRDFEVGENGVRIMIPSIAGPLLAAALVWNRVYWRVHLVRTLGIDDLCIGLSLVFLFALAIVNLVAVNHGYGQPSSSLSSADLQLALQMFYLDQIFYKFTINLTKLSILTLYLRIFTRTWFVRTCWCCFAIVSVYAVASVLVTVFQCTPINGYWDKHVRAHSPHSPNPQFQTHCINTTAFWFSNAAYNIITDIVILVTLPFMIWSLHLPRSQKIGLTVVFGLGIFVFVTSVLRLTTLEKGSQAEDPLVGTVLSMMWTMIESSTAVVCACLPMCRTPLQRLWPRLFPSWYGSAGGMQTPSETEITPAQGSGARNLGGAGGGVGAVPTVVMRDISYRSPGGAGMNGMPPFPSSAFAPGARDFSGDMLAGHRGPGGRSMDSEDDYDDLEMQAQSTCTEGSGSGSRETGEGGEESKEGILGGVVPVRMKRW